jgi:uncharacterized protein
VKNPLGQFLPVEDRIDGVYIKVDRVGKDSVQTDVILTEMSKSIVMNFDVLRFKDVYSRARGIFEKIGLPFEYYDEEFDNYCTISITPQKVSVKIAEGYLLKGKKPTDKQLLFYLKRKGVVHGIDRERLARIPLESRYEQFVDVAAATPPVDGSDARIEIKIAISPDTKPKLRGDGSVDYRSIQTFTSVSKGDLLAIKYPPGPGKPGTTVMGEPIASQPGQDVPFPQGRNTQLSPDGMQLVASTTGIVFFENTLLTIAELLHVDNDVDFSVGNIKYTGDVLINGSVKPGFTIEAEGSIHIKGEVESATITSRAGNIIIDKGVVGKGDTIITAKKGITICFAQDAHLCTEGELTFDKFLLHCRITCRSLESKGHPGSVIGGDAEAEKSVLIKQCGSDSGIATRLCIFDKNKAIVTNKIKELAQLKTNLSLEMEPIERQLKTKAALMKRAGEDVSDRNREEVKKWVDAYNGMKKKIGYVEDKIKELKARLDNPIDRDGYIQVVEHCYPGTIITLYDISFPINTTYVNKLFGLKDQSVTIEGH